VTLTYFTVTTTYVYNAHFNIIAPSSSMSTKCLVSRELNYSFKNGCSIVVLCALCINFFTDPTQYYKGEDAPQQAVKLYCSRWLSSGMLRRVVWQKFSEVSDVLPASTIRVIALMMEAVSTSITSVNFYETVRRNIPEDSHLHTRRRENLKSHLVLFRYAPKPLVDNDDCVCPLRCLHCKLPAEINLINTGQIYAYPILYTKPKSNVIACFHCAASSLESW
jgi:hypothetical protein